MHMCLSERTGNVSATLGPLSEENWVFRLKFVTAFSQSCQWICVPWVLRRGGLAYETKLFVIIQPVTWFGGDITDNFAIFHQLGCVRG